METIIEITDLCKSFKLSKKQRKALGAEFNRKLAVNNLSFQVYKGEIYGLLGNNGAGKTTTLRMLASLIKPDSGRITIAGMDALKEETEIRRHVGFLTSELKLENYFTPNYLFDFFGGLYGMSKAEIVKRKELLFERFEINEFADTKVEKLSTGMKQKVSIAVSLVNDPEIIIFDEPTNGLDVITAKAVTDYLLELREQGKTIVVSSHIFELIEKICDRVGIIIDGRLAYSNTLSDIQRESSLENKFFQIYNEGGR